MLPWLAVFSTFATIAFMLDIIMGGRFACVARVHGAGVRRLVSGFHSHFTSSPMARLRVAGLR
jgi:hypothetical protein